MNKKIVDYIENATIESLAKADEVVVENADAEVKEIFPLREEDTKIFEQRASEIKAVLIEAGDEGMAGDTTRALAAFISAVDSYDLAKLTLLYVKQLPMDLFLPLASGTDYEDTIAAFANISAKTFLRDDLTDMFAATWASFLTVVVDSEYGEPVFKTMVASMPSELYAEVFADFVSFVKASY